MRRAQQCARHIHQLVHWLTVHTAVAACTTAKGALSTTLHSSKSISILLRNQFLHVVLPARRRSLRAFLVSDAVTAASISRPLNLSVAWIQISNCGRDARTGRALLNERALDRLAVRLLFLWLLAHLYTLIKVRGRLAESIYNMYNQTYNIMSKRRPDRSAKANLKTSKKSFIFKTMFTVCLTLKKIIF